MDTVTFLLTVVGVALVALAIRSGPLLLLGGRRLPRSLEGVLEFLPMAALAALTMQVLVVAGGSLQFSASDVRLWAILPTAAVAILTRSMLFTVAVGVALVAGLRFFF